MKIVFITRHYFNLDAIHETIRGLENCKLLRAKWIVFCYNE